MEVRYDNLNQELKIVRKNVYWEKRAYTNWNDKWSWILKENENTNKKIYEIIKENEEIIIKPEEKFYNSKVSLTFHPKNHKENLFENNMEKEWPKINSTTNQNYGRFGWMPLESGGPYLERKSYFSKLKTC